MGKKKELRKALEELVDLYVRNKGTDHEFITCITPPSPLCIGSEGRERNETWRAWDNARRALGEDL